MHVQILIFLLSSGIVTATAGDLPSWVLKGPMSDSSSHYVICSYDGIDPEEARQIAESKCLASAAKLGGVKVRLTQKTVQSLSGADSSEVAEIEPIHANIKCEWVDRYLEKVKDGFRVWLRCKVQKSTFAEIFEPAIITTDLKKSFQSTGHVEVSFILSIVPKADRVIIKSLNGERVIVPESNILIIKILSFERVIEVKKNGYKQVVITVPTDIGHGNGLRRNIVLERE